MSVDQALGTKQDSPQQAVQESQYEFPYHYIPTLERGVFSQAKVLRWGYEYIAYLHFVLDTVLRHNPSSVIDVGCGDGRLLYELKKRAPTLRLTGLDRSQRAIAFARAFAPNIDWVSMNIDEFVVTAERYSSVTLIEVIEHIPPPELSGFLRTVAKLVAPDGRLVVSVPSSNVPVSRKHYQHFSEASLRSFLDEMFVVDEVHFLNQGGLLARGFRQLLSNPLFSITYARVSSWLYQSYRTHFLIGNAHNTRRICVVCRPRLVPQVS